jgi:hypothetical protein
MGRDMSDDVFGSASEVLKSELDAINEEASSLLAAARQLSVEERRALQSQCAALIERRHTAIGNLALEYAALIERRNTAIRNLLHSAFPRRLPSQGIDKNFAPEARKRGVLSNVKLKEVVAAARDTVTRASRTVMRALGTKSGRKGEAPGAARVKQTIANESCSSDGSSIQPPQVSVSTTDTLDRSLYAAVEALSKPSLNSDLKDELTKILSGIELDRDLDARRLNMPAAK